MTTLASSAPTGLAAGAMQSADPVSALTGGQTPSAEQAGLLGFIGQFRRELIAIGTFSAVINLLMLSPTLYMLQVFDRVMLSRSELTLLFLTLFVLFFYLVQSLCEWMRSKLVIGSGLKLDAAMSVPIFRATFIDQLSGLGRAPVQAFADMTVIRQWLTGQHVFAFFDLPWSPIYLAVMFMLHPWLGWLTVLFMAILGGFAWWTNRATRNLSEVAEEEEREMNDFIHTRLRNAEVIEAHGMVPNLLQRWWTRQMQILGIQSATLDTEFRFSVSSKELRVLMQSLALGAGALLAIEGKISFGAMIAASLLMGRATAPIDQIVGGWRSFMAVRKSLRRVEELLRSAPSGQVAAWFPDEPVELVLEEVKAFAKDRKLSILHSVSARFPAAQIYAVLGNSGAGKTTLGKTILGIWPETSGSVRLNGHDIGALDRSVIGPALGYLPQDIELFAGTVAENIARMGKPDPSAVIEAARLSGIHEMVLQMPKGYDTQIGEAGAHLSGGQRQRVALARALYKNPRLIVLDEPNAHLDEAGERALMKALLQMKAQGATIFLITHRPAIVRIADQIVFMADGGISLMGDRQTVRNALGGRGTLQAAPIEETSL